jgi:hypothetical protein
MPTSPKNRAFWNAASDGYQAAHGAALLEQALAWGVWRIPDALLEYQLPYGAWIRLFRTCGLFVEDLVEIQAPPDAITTYSDFVPAPWARRWPAEHVWKLRKAA